MVIIQHYNEMTMLFKYTAIKEGGKLRGGGGITQYLNSPNNVKDQGAPGAKNS